MGMTLKRNGKKLNMPVAWRSICCIMVTWLLAGSAARGTDEPYVAELSALYPQNYIGAEENIFWVPAGEFLTVAVYEADRIELVPNEGIETEVLRVWYKMHELPKEPMLRYPEEYRTPVLQQTPEDPDSLFNFEGDPEKRQVRILRYLCPTKWLKWFPEDQDWVGDQGKQPKKRMWAVRIRCGKPSVQQLDIVPLVGGQKRKRIQLTIHVTAPVPPSDCGFGFYTDKGRYGYQGAKYERMYFEHMREMGCNTFTAYSGSADDIVRQLDIAYEAGLLDKRFAVLVLDGSPDPEHFEVIIKARQIGKYSKDWPELIFYGHDEPQNTVDAAKQARALTRKIHEIGRQARIPLRTATAIGGSQCLHFGDGLDVWIVHSPGSSDFLREICQRDDKGWWMYNCRIHGTNPAFHRYYTGVWTWKVRPRVNLVWGYMQDAASKVLEDGTWNAKYVLEHALPTPEGPMATAGLEGFRDGTVDYRILRQLERLVEENPGNEQVPLIAAWFQDLYDQTYPNTFWPGLPPLDWEINYKSGTVVSTVLPPVDCASVREQALKFIEQF